MLGILDQCGMIHSMLSHSVDEDIWPEVVVVASFRVWYILQWCRHEVLEGVDSVVMRSSKDELPAAPENCYRLDRQNLLMLPGYFCVF